MTIEEINTLLNLRDEIIVKECRIDHLKRADKIEMKLWDSNGMYMTTIDMNLNELDAVIQRDESVLDNLKNRLSKYELRKGDELDD